MSDLCFNELMRCIFHWTTLSVESGQLIHSYDSTTDMHFPLDNLSARTNCEKYFSARIMLTGHDCFLSLTFSLHGYDFLLLSGTFHIKENRGRKTDSSGLWINFGHSFNNQTGKQMILLSLEKGRTTSLNVTRTVKDVV